jgi:hypothetical protein
MRVVKQKILSIEEKQYLLQQNFVASIHNEWGDDDVSDDSEE